MYDHKYPNVFCFSLHNRRPYLIELLGFNLMNIVGLSFTRVSYSGVQDTCNENYELCTCNLRRTGISMLSCICIAVSSARRYIYIYKYKLAEVFYEFKK